MMMPEVSRRQIMEARKRARAANAEDERRTASAALYGSCSLLVPRADSSRGGEHEGSQQVRESRGAPACLPSPSLMSCRPSRLRAQAQDLRASQTSDSDALVYRRLTGVFDVERRGKSTRSQRRKIRRKRRSPDQRIS